MQPIYIVDAFAEQAFAGNPAAVCPLENTRDERWMQSVANEMNLAETAFLQRRPDGDWDLRWFTPTVEVDLCGHATLASAFTLWQTQRADSTQPLRFHTRSGVLTCVPNGSQIAMDFPACPPLPHHEPRLAPALGVPPVVVGANDMDILAVLDSETTVRTLKPNMHLIAELPVRGLIVTAKGAGDIDFVSRFFAPQSGVPEDPVTGSAHCCLGPYWQSVLGKSELHGYQASARGGHVFVRCHGTRVTLTGKAVMVVQGHLS